MHGVAVFATSRLLGAWHVELTVRSICGARLDLRCRLRRFCTWTIGSANAPTTYIGDPKVQARDGSCLDE